MMLKIYFIFLLCVWGLEGVMCTRVQCPLNQEEDEESLRAEVTGGGCKPPEWVSGTTLESSTRAVCTFSY